SLSLFSLLLPPPPPSPLFPYTTLFRSIGPAAQALRDVLGDPDQLALARLKGDGQNLSAPLAADWDEYFDRFVSFYGLTDEQPTRSEEHTSELQSPYDLVCRLLLEKKKK